MCQQRLVRLLNTLGRWISGRWLEASGLFFGPKKPARISSSENSLGFKGEQVAAQYLQRMGYRIIEIGHRQRLGEIDLIAVDRNCLVFVEVKTWKSDSDQDPSMAVSRSKQEKLTRAGLIYLKEHRLLESPARFDVISIVWDGDAASQPRIRHFPNAFEAIGRGQLFS
jgi:putative endonuclease